MNRHFDVTSDTGEMRDLESAFADWPQLKHIAEVFGVVIARQIFLRARDLAGNEPISKANLDAAGNEAFANARRRSVERRANITSSAITAEPLSLEASLALDRWEGEE